MSVKIDHGHVYTGAEPFDVFEFTESLRPAFTDVAARLDARALVLGAFKAHEDSLRSSGRPPADALLAAYRAFDDEQRALAAEGWYRADMLRAFRPHEATLSIGRDALSGKILMLLNADAGEYFEALRARDDVEEYSYTTSHDGLPVGVTRAQYRARGEEWERFFGQGPILENTVSVEFRSAHDSTMRRMASKDRTADDVELLHNVEVPDTSDRACRIVNELLINEWVARRRAAEPDADVFENVMSALLDIGEADRDELIDLAASTITPSSELLERFLDGTATLGSPGLMSLSLAAADWLDAHPIGER